MFGLQGLLLLGEPCESDFGFAACTSGTLNLPQTFTVFRANCTFELGLVGPEYTAQTANRDSKIMKRFAVEPIAQTTLRQNRRS